MQVEERNDTNGQKPSKFDEYENQILLNQLEQQKNKKLEKKVEIDKKFINSQENKNLIRYLNLVVDLTHTMNIQDLKPSRLSLTIQNLDVFVKQFFDKNPLSMLGLAVCKDGVCQQLIDFSSNADTFLSIIGHPRSQIRQVSDKGDFSLQYLIEEQIRQFIDAPLYANKEVLVIQSSPCTIDTGDIYDSIEKISHCKIQVNIISLNSKTHVFNQLTKLTNGNYNTVLNEKEYEKLFKNYLEPPSYNENNITKELISVGFPNLVHYVDNYLLCQCHQKLNNQFYQCQQCLANNCSIPSTCYVCKQNLISPVQLQKSKKHNNQLNKFVIQPKQQSSLICFGCSEKIKQNTEFTQCQKCKQQFCLDCDIYIHDQLYNCPGCI